MTKTANTKSELQQKLMQQRCLTGQTQKVQVFHTYFT